MIETSTWERPSPGDLACIVGALLLTLLGEAAAIRFGSAPLAVATVIWYGLAFGVLAWYSPPLALIGLVVALPLITVEVGFGDVEKTLSSDKVALAAVVAVWVVRRIPTVSPRVTRLSPVRWWVVFLVVVLLSTLSNGATLGEIWGLLKQILYACVFLMALAVFGIGHAFMRRALLATGLAGAAVALLAIGEWVFAASGRSLLLYFKRGTMMDWWVPGSTIAHRNFLGGYLVLLLPILLALSFTAGPKVRGLLLGGGAITGLTFLYVRSMGASIGLAVTGLLAIGLAARGKLPPAVQRVSLWSFAAVVVIASAVAVPKAVSESVHLSARVATYRMGLAAVSERPFLGFGGSGFTRESGRLERQVFGRELTEFHPAATPIAAHSSFLDVAVERGLFGLAAFVGVLASILAQGVRACFRPQDLETRVLLLGLIAGLSGFIVQAFTENLFSFSKVAAIFWIVAAAVVRLAEG